MKTKVLVIAALAAAPALGAQPRPGDLVLTDIGSFKNVVWIDRLRNTTASLMAPVPSPGFTNAIAMGPINRDLAVIHSGNGNHLLRVDPTGSVTTIADVGVSSRVRIRPRMFSRPWARRLTVTNPRNPAAPLIE